jgi:hypothetical protein
MDALDAEGECVVTPAEVGRVAGIGEPGQRPAVASLERAVQALRKWPRT